MSLERQDIVCTDVLLVTNCMGIVSPPPRSETGLTVQVRGKSICLTNVLGVRMVPGTFASYRIRHRV